MRSTISKQALNVLTNLRFECDHCHKPLKRITVEIFGKECVVPCWTSCGCEESKLDGMFVQEHERKWALAGIPERYLGAECDLENRQFSVDSGESLYIYGEYGSGKTYFACALAKALLNMGNTVRFENAKRLISEIQGTYSGNNSDVLNRTFACRVLVLDDLGKEQPTPYSLSMLYEIIDTRYAANKPIVVTSNFSRAVLVERWASADAATAEAIVSRLCENCSAMRFEGRDRRIS